MSEEAGIQKNSPRTLLNENEWTALVTRGFIMMKQDPSAEKDQTISDIFQTWKLMPQLERELMAWNLILMWLEKVEKMAKQQGMELTGEYIKRAGFGDILAKHLTEGVEESEARDLMLLYGEVQDFLEDTPVMEAVEYAFKGSYSYEDNVAFLIAYKEVCDAFDKSEIDGTNFPEEEDAAPLVGSFTLGGIDGTDDEVKEKADLIRESRQYHYYKYALRAMERGFPCALYGGEVGVVGYLDAAGEVIGGDEFFPVEPPRCRVICVPGFKQDPAQNKERN